MDKAPKAVILRGGDSGEGSEIHPYSKFLDPSLLCPPRDQILAAPLLGGDPWYMKFWVNRPPLEQIRRF